MANTRELVSVVHFPPNVNIYRHNNVQKTAESVVRTVDDVGSWKIRQPKRYSLEKEGLTRDRVRRAESSGQTRLNTVIEIP